MTAKARIRTRDGILLGEFLCTVNGAAVEVALGPSDQQTAELEFDAAIADIDLHRADGARVERLLRMTITLCRDVEDPGVGDWHEELNSFVESPDYRHWHSFVQHCGSGKQFRAYASVLYFHLELHLVEPASTGTARPLNIGSNIGSGLQVLPAITGSATGGFIRAVVGDGAVGAIGVNFANSFNPASGVSTQLAVQPVINGSETMAYTALLANVTETSIEIGSRNLILAQLGGVDRFSGNFQPTNSSVPSNGSKRDCKQHAWLQHLWLRSHGN